jgi:hypothetical protein
VDAMRAYRFDVMGLERSYYDFYVGFGWLLGAYLAPFQYQQINAFLGAPRTFGLTGRVRF